MSLRSTVLVFGVVIILGLLGVTVCSSASLQCESEEAFCGMGSAEQTTAMAASRLNLVMFLGSVREGRLGERVAKFLENQLKSKYEITLLDPLELDLPLMRKPLHHYNKDPEVKEVPPQVLLDVEKKLKAADAFLVISTEYNHSIPPALANLMDHFPDTLFSYKPSGIVCYSAGIYGGMRAAMQLRSFLSELGTLSVPNIMGIPEVYKALDEDGKPQNDHLETSLDSMMKQLDWHAHAFKNHREKFGLPGQKL